MSVRFHRVMVVALLWTSACTSTEPRPKPREGAEEARSAAPELPADLQITLARTACYGSCPVYEVKVDAKGHVAWQGKQYVDQEGAGSHQLESLDALADLWRRLDAIDYSALPSEGRIGRNSAMCPSYSTDSPSVMVTIVANGTTHYVYDYLGCDDYAPVKAFRELERELDVVLGTKEWIEPR